MEKLTWNGKIEEPRMYLPILLSLQPILEHLDVHFHDLGLNYDVIVAEILKETLTDQVGTYGPHGEGMDGAFKTLAPPNRPDPNTDSLILHEAQLILIDIINELMPDNDIQTTYPYYYPHSDSFVLYVPTNPQSIQDPQIRAKLVPHAALRYLDY